MADDRVPVTTRVPGYQKEAWLDDADELDMSQSEFVRTMVQAGRRELGLAEETAETAPRGAAAANGESSGVTAATANGGSSEAAATSHSADTTAETTAAETAAETAADEPLSPGAYPGGHGLEDRVLDVLREEGACSWDELLETVVGDFEERLDETMSELQQSGTVHYSGREGGYVLNE
jgi:hypothetical protein